jgi:nucleotide-binding universal stress UspA family protein
MSKEIQRILVAIDFSEHSLAAARLATSIALAKNAEVALIYVGQPTSHISIGAAAAKAISRDVERASETKLRSIANELSDSLQCNTMLRTGDPARCLLGFAVEWQADIIVMGSRGADSVGRHWLGSVAARVACESRCPVIATRADQEENFPKNGIFEHVLVAIDYSKFSLPAAEVATRLAAPQSTIEMIHIFVAPEEAEEEMRLKELQRLGQFAKQIDLASVEISLTAELGRVAEQLLDYSVNSKTDLVIVGAHGRDEASSYLGSVANRLLLGSTVPVVILPDTY